MGKKRDNLDRQQLINDAQGMVYSIASRVHRSIPIRVDFDDLVAYGEVGLAEAARDFDPLRGAQFTTFAYYRIRGAMYDGLAEMTWMSRARFRRIRYQQMANEILIQESNTSSPANSSLGKTHDLMVEAQWLGDVSEKLAVAFMSTNQGELQAKLVDHRSPSPTQLAQQEIGERLVQAVNELPAQQERLIRFIYFEGNTLQQAADRLGMSKSWASRLHSKTLEELAIRMRKIGAG
jgi:RNA polymerase sigma factor for flagellar operon FliA